MDHIFGNWGVKKKSIVEAKCPFYVLSPCDQSDDKAGPYPSDSAFPSIGPTWSPRKQLAAHNSSANTLEGEPPCSCAYFLLTGPYTFLNGKNLKYWSRLSKKIRQVIYIAPD